MRRIVPLVLVLSLFATACTTNSDDSAGESPTTAATSTSANTPTTSSAVPGDDQASPLVIVAVDFAAGSILIRNTGDADYDLTGHWVCNRPTYSELPSEVLAPGTTIEIDTAVIGLSADSGEVALYESRDFGNADDILRYVQWGTDSHGRTEVAVSGGVWRQGDFVDNQGGSIESTASNPVSSADWSSS